MYVAIVDVLAAILLVAGIVLLVRSSKSAGTAPDAGTYGRRIVGTMMAAFGLAIGMMVTLFHFASAG
jgi:hypothetical protein